MTAGEPVDLAQRCADLEDLVRDLHSAATSAGAFVGLSRRELFPLLREVTSSGSSTERVRG